MFTVLLYTYIFLIFLDAITKRLGYSYKSRNKLFCFLFFSTSAFVMGVRGINVGQDTSNYYQIYQEIKFNSVRQLLSGDIYTIEPLYLLIMKLLSWFSISYWGFQVVISSIFCLISGYIIYKHCQDPILGSAVFLGDGLYLLSFNIARQMISVCFITLLYFALINNKKAHALIYAFLALLFHKTAIISESIIFIIYLIRYNKLILRLSPILILLLIPLFDIIFSMLEFMVSAYSNYLDNHKNIQTAGLSKIVWGIDFVIAVLLLYSQKLNTSFSCIGIFILFFIVFNIIGLRFNYAERMGAYFLFFISIGYSLFKNIISNNAIKHIYRYCTIACYLILYYISTLTPQYKNYTFFF